MFWKKEKLSEPLLIIKKELKRNEHTSTNKALSLGDEMLIKQIREQTVQLNKNNVTRTTAYLHFYHKHPKIHWSLLAHLVSRNAGWNMTDLQGTFLTRLLSEKERHSFFAFLERGNWLIFQDAYPQLLIYEASMKRGKNLFELLSYFHTSFFMKTIWNQYWQRPDSALLTYALIVNEQNYIQPRLLENVTFQKEVLNTLEFQLQDLLTMNHLLMPLKVNDQIHLKGSTLHHFGSLHNRILFGKKLYSLLFGNRETLKKVEQWAREIPHTGSRKDYWPHLFNDLNEDIPGKTYKPKLKKCKLQAGLSRFYSPKLPFAWKNVKHSSPNIKDWYTDWRVIYELVESKIQTDGEIEQEYCHTLSKMELAILAKQVLSIFDKEEPLKT
ncbi:MAG: DUF2515 family protein [Bacillus sp. (in: firmicutes)]